MIHIHLKDDFNLEAIFNCGQAFRWTPVSKASENEVIYEGVVHGQLTRVTQEKQLLKIECIGLTEGNSVLTEDFWWHYFDLDRSYQFIRELLVLKNPKLSEAIAFGCGLRILNQDPFEMLLTFIISANNNIPRIEKSIQLLSATYGKVILPHDAQGVSSSGNRCYSFPLATALESASIETVRSCGVGYRDRYLIESSKQWIAAGGENFGLQLSQLEHQEAKKRLMAFTGVGAKVADCILLFCAGQHDAFPIDTWMSKALTRYYGDQIEMLTPKTLDAFIDKQFGNLKGFAQQYIFHFERNGKK